MKKKSFKLYFFIVFSLIVINLDRLLNSFFNNTFLVEKEMPLISNFLKIKVVKNKGISFSLFENNEIITLIIPIILLVGILVFLIVFLNKLNVLFVIFLSLVFSGGLSNLIFRIFDHYVLDYISVLNFPIFNFSDSVIFIGIVGIITLLLVDEIKKKRGSKEEPKKQ